MFQLENYKYYQKGVIFKGAAHVETKLTKDQKKALLARYNAWFVRNCYDFDCKEETSFWRVICDSPVTIEGYKTSVRNQVRKSLKTMAFRKLLPSELVEYGGYNVYIKSYDRYSNVTGKIMSEHEWTQIIISRSEDKEYWGGFRLDDNKLIVYGDALIQDRGVKYTALKGDMQGNQNLYPFYGILHTMNEYYINESKMLYVSDGARSISEHSGIQEFLTKFNFRKAYCKIDIRYVWWLKMVINTLYPFRNTIKVPKVKYLLRFEAIRRGEY